jgi:hypothetical protein
MADVLNPNAAHRQTTDRATSRDTIPRDELHQKISTDHINRQNENPLMGQLLPLPSRDIPPRKHLQPLDTLCVHCMPLLAISSLAKDLLGTLLCETGTVFYIFACERTDHFRFPMRYCNQITLYPLREPQYTTWRILCYFATQPVSRPQPLPRRCHKKAKGVH